jgi:mRNA interferase HigB
MHVITKKRICEAIEKFSDSKSALDGWYKVMSKNHFDNYSGLKSTFKGVDKVGNLYVFNIGGNKLRLITSIHFNRQKIYVRYILTHKEYDNDHWKNSR